MVAETADCVFPSYLTHFSCHFVILCVSLNLYVFLVYIVDVRVYASL